VRRDGHGALLYNAGSHRGSRGTPSTIVIHLITTVIFHEVREFVKESGLMIRSTSTFSMM
jgi:hypothetical protein